MTSDYSHGTLRELIKNIRHRGLRKLYKDDDKRQINPELVSRLERVLAQLEAAEEIKELNLPGNRLHALKGDLKGFWSITINANWRVIFRFEDGDVHDVDFLDYH